jgi:hypothetical protein
VSDGSGAGSEGECTIRVDGDEGWCRSCRCEVSRPGVTAKITRRVLFQSTIAGSGRTKKVLTIPCKSPLLSLLEHRVLVRLAVRVLPFLPGPVVSVDGRGCGRRLVNMCEDSSWTVCPHAPPPELLLFWTSCCSVEDVIMLNPAKLDGRRTQLGRLNSSAAPIFFDPEPR